MGRETELLQIDAFTAEPFAGNPAAVCFLPEPRSDAWLQAVAAELNLSETAFLEPRSDGFGLRWFTPLEMLRQASKHPIYKAVAVRREGVVEAFFGLLQLTFRNLNKQTDFKRKFGISERQFLRHIVQQMNLAPGQQPAADELMDSSEADGA